VGTSPDNKKYSNKIETALWSFDPASMQLHIQGKYFIQNIIGQDADNYSIDIDTYLKDLCREEDRIYLGKNLPFLCTKENSNEFEHSIWNKKLKKWCKILIHSLSNMPAQTTNSFIFGSFQCLDEKDTQQHYLDYLSEFTECNKSMLNSSPICCFFLDENYRSFDCNQKALDLFGLSNKQEFTNNFFSLSPKYQSDNKDSHEKAIKLIKYAFKEGYTNFEWIHKKPDGELIPAEITLVRIKHNDKFIVVGYAQDLRKLKASLAEKNIADERSQLMIDSSPLCATFWDKNYNVVDCNQEAVRLFELSNKQEYMDKFYELSPKYQPDGMDSFEKVKNFVRKAFNDEYVNFEWMHQKPNGELIPTEITLVLVKYSDGFLVIGYTRDLRELKAMLKEKNRIHEFNQVMLDSSPLCAIFWDDDYNIIDCNQEAVRLFGLSNKQEYMDKFYELSPEYQPDGSNSFKKAQELIMEASKTGYAKFEWMHQKLNGELIPSEITILKVKYNKGFLLMGYSRDLRELKAMLKEKNEADARNQIMLDATPLCANFWDENFNNVDCNQEAVRLFELLNKEDYLANFHKLSPEYQPDGQISSKKAIKLVTLAFKDGYAKFEWMHQKLNGELIPTEIILVRMKYDDKFIVAGYTRDLREFKAMLKKKNEADARNQIMLDATPLCANFWDENFNNLDCNQEAVRLFDLSNKEDYLTNFHKLSP